MDLQISRRQFLASLRLLRPPRTHIAWPALLLCLLLIAAGAALPASAGRPAPTGGPPAAGPQQDGPPYLMTVEAAYCPVTSITIPGGGVVTATVLYNDISCCANYGCSWYNHATGPAHCDGPVHLWTDVDEVYVAAADWELNVGDTYRLDTGTSGVIYGQRPDSYCADNGPIPPWTATRRSAMDLAFTPVPVDARKTASASVVAPDGTVTYTVELHWDGESGEPADSTMSDPLPQYTEYVPGSAWANMGTVDTSDPSRISWSGSIPDGMTATIRYRLRVPCAGLMDKPLWEWPSGILNRAAGRIGPDEYAVFVAPEGITLLQPDLQITGLELTQAVQNLANDVPLIRGKEIYARLYLKLVYPGGVDGCAMPGVTAELRGAPGAPLTPINGEITAQALPGQDRPTQQERDNLGQSLFFGLPYSWYNYGSNYVLTAAIDPAGERADGNRNNNTLVLNVAPVDTAERPLYIVPIRYTFASPPLEPDREDIIRALQMVRLWPIAYEDLAIRWLRPHTLAYPVRYDKMQRMLIHDLFWTYAANSKLTRGHFVGVLHKYVSTTDPDTNRETRGLSFVGGTTLWAKLRRDLEGSGLTMMHELSHNLGRLHVDCPVGGVGGPIDPGWPAAYPTCWLSDGARDGYYGFDPWAAMQGYLRKPQSYADVMSYADRRWISDYTYRAALARLQATAGLQETPLQFDRLLVSGVISPTTPTGTLEYVFALDNANFSNDPVTGTYTLELQDAGGQVLVSDTFGVQMMEESAGSTMLQGADRPSAPDTAGGGSDAQWGMMYFLRALPYDAQGARLVLKDGATVLDTRLASATPPTVTWSYPNGGETLTGTVDLSWTGADADGDPLTYIVQYSNDGGTNWEPVTVLITATQATVDTAEFPGGSSCLFRVLASDGFYTAIDRGDGFSTVPRQEPTALILFPQEGQCYPAGQTLTLWGMAYDQDLQDLPAANLSWSSDRDGGLGTGSPREVLLSRGWHTVTLSVADGQGLSATDQVSFCIGYSQTYLPLVTRAGDR